MSTDPETKKPSLLGPLASAYEPSSADADRVLAKLTAALAAPAVAPSPPSPPPAPRASGAVKYAALAGVAAVAVAIFALRGETTPAPAPAPAAVVTTESAPAAAPASEAPALPSIGVDSLPTAAPVVTALSVSKAAPSADGTDALAREARLLADARRAAATGDATRGLALLDEHARTFPNGFLASERAAERVIVLCTLGRREEAVAAGKAFLANRPASPLTRRVSLSCAGQE